MENLGKVNLELIEVQLGSYLGGDDIVRFEDKYGRIEQLRFYSLKISAVWSLTQQAIWLSLQVP
jgi:hypothetical protein